MVIYLDCPSPNSSSRTLSSENAAYPETRRAAVSSPVWPCFRWGLHSIFRYRKTGGLLHRHSTLTQHSWAVLFLLHFPGSHLRRTLSGTLPYEARTFLSFRRDHPCCSFCYMISANLCLYTVRLLLWSETHHRSQDMLNGRLHIYYFGRLQSYVRLIPDVLVLRSKIGLVNRFLPRINMFPA